MRPAHVHAATRPSERIAPPIAPMPATFQPLLMNVPNESRWADYALFLIFALFFRCGACRRHDIDGALPVGRAFGQVALCEGRETPGFLIFANRVEALG